jgi:glycine cleavage system H protein
MDRAFRWQEDRYRPPNPPRDCVTFLTNATGTIGVSAYAAKALGDVVYVELPSIDLEVNAGESIGAVESVKSASDIMTPVAGKIVEANNVLEDKPGTINQSPEADGWLAKIEVADAAEVDALMDADAYKAFTEEADS